MIDIEDFYGEILIYDCKFEGVSCQFPIFDFCFLRFKKDPCLLIYPEEVTPVFPLLEDGIGSKLRKFECLSLAAAFNFSVYKSNFVSFCERKLSYFLILSREPSSRPSK